MPLLGLRPVDPEKEFRRRSTLDLTSLFHTNVRPPQISSSTTNLQNEMQEGKVTDRSQVSGTGNKLTEKDDGHTTEEPGEPASPPVQRLGSNQRRFSVLKFRHASDSQLSVRAKRQAENTPPMPPVPVDAPKIITTAPTSDDVSHSSVASSKKKTSLSPFRSKTSLEIPQPRGLKNANSRTTTDPGKLRFGSIRLKSLHASTEDVTSMSAARPASVLGFSQRSDSSQSISSGQRDALPMRHGSVAAPRFKLPGRRKTNKSLFPLPDRTPSPRSEDVSASPKRSRSPRNTTGYQRPLSMYSPPVTSIQKPISALENINNSTSSLPFATLASAAPAVPSSSSALQSSTVSFAPAEQSITRNNSTISARSTSSSPARRSGSRAGLRPRLSTMASISGHSGRSEEIPPTPSLPGSCRTSTSTAGRSSFSNFFSKYRQNSDVQSPRFGSPSHNLPGTPAFSSKQNSFSLSREVLHVPSREEGETPGKYLARLEESVPRSLVASTMSKSGDQFSLAVLRSHMRSFSFFGDPMDMALRKLLMEVTLPKETQQIDRVVQGFADRYHECNPGIFASAEQAYFIAFSLIILHTDVFNKNNKHKMQKSDYLKNSSTEGISEDVLACFYDNISYTPFIHVDDDSAMSNSISRKGTNPVLKAAVAIADPSKKSSKEPIDPYNLILDSKLDSLRPNLKHVMNLEDPYNYLGTADSLNVRSLQRSFFRCGVLQIVSARSRPDAFMSPATIDNPQEAQAGVVEIKVTKVGILWRKDSKKRAARSPWQEWGAILTGTQLYLFKSSNWVKNLIHQHEQHQKQGHGGTPVIFKPALPEFKPDAFLSTENAVALTDANYKRHKNAFVFVRHGGIEETLLADNEQELNDWIAMLNYAAAFTTAGVRIRGLVGGNYEGQRNRAIRQLESSNAGNTVQTASGEVVIQSGKIDRELAKEILAARRDMMQQKIEESEEKISISIKQLDSQLRDARHLQILAPLQPRTRELVVHAAGRMSAKLKWARLEIWKMKCHRDILVLDLEEEKKNKRDTQDKFNKMVSSNITSTLPTLNTYSTPSKTNGASSPENQPNPKLAKLSIPKTSPQLSQRNSVLSEDGISPMDEIFMTPSVSRNASPIRHMNNNSLSAQTAPGARRGSEASMSKASDTDNILGHQPSVSSMAEQQKSSPTISEAASRLASSSPDDREKELLCKAGLIDSDGRPRTADGSSDWYSGSPEQRTKVRHSLQRTLRDGRDPTPQNGPQPSHHRSRKGRDSNSSVVVDESGVYSLSANSGQSPGGNTSVRPASYANDITGSHDGASRQPEVLPRSHGSFRVHGKKASVISFGADWQKGPAEQRLWARKMSSATDMKPPDALPPATASGGEEAGIPPVTVSGISGDTFASADNSDDSSYSECSAMPQGKGDGESPRPLPRLPLNTSSPAARGPENADADGNNNQRISLMDVNESDNEEMAAVEAEAESVAMLALSSRSRSTSRLGARNYERSVSSTSVNGSRSDEAEGDGSRFRVTSELVAA